MWGVLVGGAESEVGVEPDAEGADAVPRFSLTQSGVFS